MGRSRREVRRTALSVAEGSRDTSFQSYLKSYTILRAKT